MRDNRPRSTPHRRLLVPATLVLVAWAAPAPAGSTGPEASPRPAVTTSRSGRFTHVAPEVVAPASDPGLFSVVRRSTAHVVGGPAREAAAKPPPAVPLDEARRAAWEGRLDEAVTAFRRLVESTPDDPDLRGELGNVLWAAGRRDDAALEYAEAAALLARSDRRAEADRLVGIVSSVDLALGRALAHRVRRPLDPASPAGPTP